MQISGLQSKVDASHVSLESLAGNKSLSQDQKIAEASRQFEAILLRQFLSESQQPVIKSSFTDDSNTAGIYQDMVTNQLSDTLSRNGGIGLAKTFERQLTPHAPHHAVYAGVSTQSAANQSTVSKPAALLMPKPAPQNQTTGHHGLHSVTHP